MRTTLAPSLRGLEHPGYLGDAQKWNELSGPYVALRQELLRIDADYFGEECSGAIQAADSHELLEMHEEGCHLPWRELVRASMESAGSA